MTCFSSYGGPSEVVSVRIGRSGWIEFRELVGKQGLPLMQHGKSNKNHFLKKIGQTIFYTKN